MNIDLLLSNMNRHLLILATTLLILNVNAFGQKEFPKKETKLDEVIPVTSELRYELQEYRIIDTITFFDDDKSSYSSTISKTGYEFWKIEESNGKRVKEQLSFPEKFEPRNQREKSFKVQLLDDSVFVAHGFSHTIYVRHLPYFAITRDGGKTWSKMSFDQEWEDEIENNSHFFDPDKSIVFRSVGDLFMIAETSDGWKTKSETNICICDSEIGLKITPMREEKGFMFCDCNGNRASLLQDGPISYGKKGSVIVKLKDMDNESKKFTLSRKKFGGKWKFK